MHTTMLYIPDNRKTDSNAIANNAYTIHTDISHLNAIKCIKLKSKHTHNQQMLKQMIIRSRKTFLVLYATLTCDLYKFSAG